MSRRSFFLLLLHRAIKSSEKGRCESRSEVGLEWAEWWGVGRAKLSEGQCRGQTRPALFRSPLRCSCRYVSPAAVPRTQKKRSLGREALLSDLVCLLYSGLPSLDTVLGYLDTVCPMGAHERTACHARIRMRITTAPCSLCRVPPFGCPGQVAADRTGWTGWTGKMRGREGRRASWADWAGMAGWDAGGKGWLDELAGPAVLLGPTNWSWSTVSRATSGCGLLQGQGAQAHSLRTSKSSPDNLNR